MKKIYITLTFLAAGMIACNSVPTGISQPDAPLGIELTGEEKAVKLLNDFIASLTDDSETRAAASAVEIAAIRRTDASAYNGGQSTRSSAPAMPLYELTLRNDDDTYGYAVVAGSNNFNEVIAYSPQGSIADTTYNKALALYFREMAEFSAIATAADEDPSNPRWTHYWQPGRDDFNYMPYEFIGDEIFVKWLTDSEKASFYSNPSQWSYISDLPYYIVDSGYKHVNTIWHQRAPYNDNAPIVPTTGEKYPIGCFAVAAGQVIATLMNRLNFDEPAYDWAALTANRVILPGNTHAATEVARFLRDVADAADMQYGIYNNKPGGAVTNTKMYNFFRNMGLSCTRRIMGTQDDFPFLVNELENNRKPLIFSANVSGKNIGHAWVVDGVYSVSKWYYYAYPVPRTRCNPAVK